MTRALEILRVEAGGGVAAKQDVVAVEEPLEIRVEGEPIAVAMRTPGHDRELVAGWLLSEGIVRSAADISELIPRPGEESQSAAMVDVILCDRATFTSAKYRRKVLTNASCGLCGAASVEQVLRDFPMPPPGFRINAAVLYQLPALLRDAQPLFERTGGVHACALFDRNAELLAVREDVGRHNALDKLMGWALLGNQLPLSEHILLLSGRVSLEMIQKALAAGIPIVAALGAPSSLAVDLARSAGLGLAAFLKPTSMNIYSGFDRFLSDAKLSVASQSSGSSA